jgi:hypothetical protein
MDFFKFKIYLKMKENFHILKKKDSEVKYNVKMQESKCLIHP